MKPKRLLIPGLLFLSSFGCNSNTPQQDFSTVDSSILKEGDSIPPILYLDSQIHDTSFDIALDSPGYTIQHTDSIISP